MKFGLPDEFVDAVKVFGNANNSVEKIILFGSRVTVQHRNGSDVDLALVGKHLTMDDIIHFEQHLETLDCLNKFDILIFNTISSLPLKEQIIASGIPLYTKASHLVGIK
jgi:predicted nucleotidyltransferase